MTQPRLSAEELAETWREDKDGEYVQINDDGAAHYIAHGTAIEKICDKTVTVSRFSGRGVGSFNEEDVDRTRQSTFKAIRDWMKRAGFFPNIWEVNERGNVELYDARGNSLGVLV
jgi:hypothetical protein